MNKNNFRNIIILMSLALIGLACFQFYWINNSAKVSKERLFQDANTAIQRAVSKMETEDALYYTYQSMQSSFKRQMRFDRAFGAPVFAPDSLNRPIRLPNAESRTTIIDTLFSFQHSIDLAGNGSVEIEFFEGNINSQNNPIPGVGSTPGMGVAGSRNPQSQLELMREMLQGPQMQRNLDSGRIAKFLSAEMENQGINLGYEFAVWNKAAEDWVIIGGEDTKALAETPLEVNLFPSDLIENQNYLQVHFPQQSGFLFRKMWPSLLSSGALMLIIMGCFAYAINTILEQKKLSEIKNDFVNNMTHEFKTPISTVSLATEMLRDPDVSKSRSLTDRYLTIISDENVRLANQVEKVLQMATLEKKDFNLKLEPVSVHEIINKATEHLNLQVSKREGNLNLKLNARNDQIEADRLHLNNILHNLLDNANKYSSEKPEITVNTEDRKEGILIRVMDKGIGMSAEALQKIFDRFYRVHTGNLHDVKGFGLGLTYVKTMIEAHGGNIKVRSQPQVGSTFEIFLPYKANG